jgi:hypothetical protein
LNELRRLTMNTWKCFCAGLVLVLTIGGPLAPLTVAAQMQTPPPGPSATGPYEPTQGERVGTAFLNVVYVPGKVITCAAGTVASAGLMILTFGSQYQAASSIFREGCGGSWVLTPYDVAERESPEERSY